MRRLRAARAEREERGRYTARDTGRISFRGRDTQFVMRGARSSKLALERDVHGLTRHQSRRRDGAAGRRRVASRVRCACGVV